MSDVDDNGHATHLTPEQQDEVSAQLQTIVSQRAVIEQAKGILMAFYDLDAQGAFAVLRDFSMTENIKVNDLAETLVSGVRQRLRDTPVNAVLDDLFANISMTARHRSDQDYSS
ncbi:hypothetical protein BVC93_13260 [Mycobacterium sp. MS1601]|uniref:ANTAR domain-containing protein n=1 Tax=Mycobacterium sp. MS1601 TaxID=1936029 RepID=UPI0009795A15|nr:ANTAR domain-containing protein [Mycobacterium sp. MS1601]AQA03226.1 hypothetical protein BVC93_13260 [Mycobacterium sp. MS1601]